MHTPAIKLQKGSKSLVAALELGCSSPLHGLATVSRRCRQPRQAFPDGRGTRGAGQALRWIPNVQTGSTSGNAIQDLNRNKALAVPRTPQHRQPLRQARQIKGRSRMHCNALQVSTPRKTAIAEPKTLRLNGHVAAAKGQDNSNRPTCAGTAPGAGLSVFPVQWADTARRPPTRSSDRSLPAWILLYVHPYVDMGGTPEIPNHRRAL